jgi:putative transposase
VPHQQAQRQRREFHRKTALALVRQYDVIYDEDLRVANLVRNHHLAKSHFGRGLEGGPVHPRVQGRTCWETRGGGQSGMDVPGVPEYDGRVYKGLSVQWQACPTCGTSRHRDHNAARNMHWRGQRLRGVPAMAGVLNREPAGR